MKILALRSLRKPLRPLRLTLSFTAKNAKNMTQSYAKKTFMKYKTETEIITIVESFENCTISRESWKHAEHLTVAMHYAINHNYTTAYEKMKSGIFKLLNAFGVDLNVEMPYHETLTVFWLRTVFDSVKANPNKNLLESTNEIIEKFDKDYPLKSYSRELLFSVEARTEFVEADLHD
jgi:hypothetical protein